MKKKKIVGKIEKVRWEKGIRSCWKKKKEKKKKEKRTWTIGHWCAVKVRWEEAKVIRMVCGQKSSGGIGERVISHEWGYIGESICVKVLWQHFSLLLFLLIWEDQNCGPGRENFLPGFLSFPFSFPNQTVKNNIFHPIFLSLFSILPVFTPTKHTLRVCLDTTYLLKIKN